MTTDAPTVQSLDTELGGGLSKKLVLHWLYPTEHVQVFPLDASVYSIGREASCNIRIDSPSVSRAHAELRREGPIYTIRNLSATKGTYVDGVPIEHTVARPGRLLRVGDCVGVFSVEFGEQPGPTGLTEISPGFFASANLRASLATAKKVALTDLPILIVGETGTGKERVARAIHDWSTRAGLFSAVNCAALPVQLAESELFGFRRGAFSGAVSDSPGKLLAAHQGTVFLDELADLPLPVQAKLLRVVEDKQVIALGATAAKTVNIRFLAATQVPLEELVAQNLFREDLCQRLSAVVVKLPPLRERKQEIPELFLHFLKLHRRGQCPAIDAKFIEQLCLYEWPGNVRELELLARQLAVTVEPEQKLVRSMLPGRMRSALTEPEAQPAVLGEKKDRREYELELLVREFLKNGRNLTAAAKTLGFSRQRAYRLLQGRTIDELCADTQSSESDQ